MYDISDTCLCLQASSRMKVEKNPMQDEKTVLQSAVEDGLCVILNSLGENDQFGEESCILSIPSPTSYMAHSFCKALSLDGHDLEQIMCHHGPGMALQSSGA